MGAIELAFYIKKVSRYMIWEKAFLLSLLTFIAIGLIHYSLITIVGIICLPILILWRRFCFAEIELNVREKIFFIFLAATFALSKNFSVLGISVGGLPLFVSEGALFFLLATIFLPRSLMGNARSTQHPIFYLFMAYFLLGILNLSRGLPSHGVFALRDAAMVYYAGFFLITVEIFDTLPKFKALIRGLLPSAIIALTIGFLYFTQIFPQTGLLQYTKAINFNYYYGFIMIFALCFYPGVSRHKFGLSILFFVSLFVVTFMQVRAIWVSMAVTLAFIFFMLKKELWQIVPRNILISFFLLPLLFGVGYSIKKGNILTLGREAVSIFRSDMDYGSAANNRWRLMVWEQTINKGLRNHPFFGSGFGVDYGLTLGGRNIADIRGVGPGSGIIPPHNGQITLFYKMGIIGQGIFLIINIYFFIICLNFYKGCSALFQRQFMLAIMASQIHFNVGAFFFEAIEIPQVGIFLWVIMGLGVALMQLGKRTKLNR